MICSGLFINIYAVAFLFISVIFPFFPPGIPVTPFNMNWSVVVFDDAVLFGLLFYAVRGRKNYDGPINEISLLSSFEQEL
jgi:hypothetical protein